METSTLHISAPFKDRKLSFGDKLPLDVYYYHTNFQKKSFLFAFFTAHTVKAIFAASNTKKSYFKVIVNRLERVLRANRQK